MKSVFLSAAIFLCMFIPATAAHSTSWQPGREVLRERIARFNPVKLLCQQNLSSISLHPFDDVRLKAVGREEQRDQSGFLLWEGKIEGVRGGKLVLVVRDGLLFASVYLSSTIIQIRPVNSEAGDDSQGYVIRELAKPWRGGSTDQVFRSCGSGSALSPEAKRLIELVNLERKADGLEVLEYSGRLTQAASRHAMDMAGHDSCSHQMSDGEKFYQNVFESGYPASEVGENLAIGYATAEETFECMLSSPEHRHNIMNSHFTHIGASEAENAASTFHYFWAEEFGSAS